MQKKLFDIISYERYDNKIHVHLSDNRYTDNYVRFDSYMFFDYLDRHDKLYTENTFILNKNDVVTSMIKLDEESYFEMMEEAFIEQDLYDYITCRIIDWDEAWSHIKTDLDIILTNIKKIYK
jgi:hypothetical protein